MTNKLRLFSGICLAAALSIGSGVAQVRGTLGVTLPQKFSVNGVELPAGEYRIHEVTGSGANAVLLFRAASGESVNVLVEPITKARQETAAESSVTLHQVGDHLRLDEVWLAGSDVGFHVLSFGN